MKSLALRWAALVLLLGLLVRAVIAWELLALPELESVDVWQALLIGGYHDLFALALLSGPLALALLVNLRFARAVLFLLIALVLIVTFAEMFFWWEFENRLNRLVFHYLLFPREVVVFLEDQFYLSIYAVPAIAVIYGTYRFVAANFPLAMGQLAQSLMILVILACGGSVLMARPWEFSDSRRINQMASNGYLGVSHAATTDEAIWHGRYWRPETPVPDPGPAERAEVPPPLAVKHVVMIIEESFAGEVWSRPELRAQYLPRLSALMGESVNFEQIYTTGSRTTRGLEALLNGFPPLPGIALSQREGFERLPSLPRALGNAGFYSAFVYGGWPDFSNFFDYWRALGYDELTSRHDFSSTGHETSWGVADEFLFARVREEMSRLSELHERVFVTTLTVSHHRPFDFPSGRIAFPAEDRRSEYALAYADWALGQFLEDAREDPWFRDTLFVVVADHGPRIKGDSPIPVEGFRVPLLFYSPAHLEPRSVNHLGSSMSVGVTLLELLGVPNDEGLYGNNLLHGTEGLVPVEHEYHVGLLTREGLTALHRGGALSGWRYEGERLVPSVADPQVGARAAKLFSDAHEWFYHPPADGH